MLSRSPQEEPFTASGTFKDKTQTQTPCKVEKKWTVQDEKRVQVGAIRFLTCQFICLLLALSVIVKHMPSLVLSRHLPPDIQHDSILDDHEQTSSNDTSAPFVLK